MIILLSGLDANGQIEGNNISAGPAVANERGQNRKRARNGRHNVGIDVDAG
jgi:hypothetical protein